MGPEAVALPFHIEDAARDTRYQVREVTAKRQRHRVATTKTHPVGQPFAVSSHGSYRCTMHFHVDEVDATPQLVRQIGRDSENANGLSGDMHRSIGANLHKLARSLCHIGSREAGEGILHGQAEEPSRTEHRPDRPEPPAPRSRCAARAARLSPGARRRGRANGGRGHGRGSTHGLGHLLGQAQLVDGLL